MPLVRVFFNPLDGQDKQEHQVAAGTQIIDFLQAEYPDGFDGGLRVFVGIEEIEIDDLDLELTETDLVTLLVMPVGGISLGAIILSALISTAIGFVINLIFKPSQPNAYTQESESPVYSLNATRNDARLGDPISSHYGTISYPPDFASAPYIWYWWGSNDQYVDELLCLGHGKFDIDQIYIGDTPITAIAPGTVRYWIFDVDQHQRTMGVITDAIWQDVKDSDTPWPFRENVITSPEVEDFQFNKDRSEQITTPTAFAGSAFATAVDPVTGETILGHIANVDSTLDIRVGDTLTLAGTASNNGDFVIGSVTIDVDFPGIMKLFQREDAEVGFADEDPLPGTTTYVLNTVAPDLIAGPFRAQKLGQQVNCIDCDIIFAQGLYRVDGDSGAIKSATVRMEFTYQMIDEADGSPIGAPIVATQDYFAKKRQPLRFTKTTWNIPNGAYEVTVRRVTEIPDDNRIHDKVTWAGLKGAIVYQNTPAYGGVTLMAIRLKATNGMGSAARSRIRVTAKRRLGFGESDNPITVIKDIWTSSVYGLGRPLEELDMETMDSFEQQWSESPKFNGSFDNRSTGFDAMQNVASLAGAKIIQDGGLTSIVLDRVQPVRSAMFTSANTVKGSMEIQYTFDTTNDYDSVQIEYRDATTFQPVFITFPDTGTRPDTFTLFGCTDDTYALEFATYLYNVKTIRRKSVKFQTELEGLIPRFGDRIAISTTLADWGQSGVVIDVVNDTTFVLDQDLDWTVDPKIMLLRSPEGNASSEYTVTQGGSPNIVVFPSVPDVAVNGPQSIEPTSYAFGTTYNLVKDFMMTKMTPKGETIVEIEGQNYVEEIYDGAPPHMRDPCIVTVPDTDIPSTSIWDETDADLPIFYLEGVVGVDGDEIIAAPSGRKIIHSTDRGKTWTTYPASLPDDPSVAGDLYHLVPSKWVKSNGRWYANLRSRESNTANNGCVIGYTVDGSSWTLGPSLNGANSNGKYSASNLILDNGQAVLFGRPNSPNNAQGWKYDDDLGSDPNLTNVVDISPSANGIGSVDNWENNGYLGFIAQSTNSSGNVWAVNNNCTVANWYENYRWPSTETSRYTDNSAGVVVFGNNMVNVTLNDNFSVLTTATGYTAQIQTAARDATATGPAMLASKPHIWLASSPSSPGDFGKWGLEYSLDTIPSSFTYPCNVILPDIQTSSGLNGNSWWIGPATEGWWIGWYRKASDQKLRIIKFQFEAYSGSCG